MRQLLDTHTFIWFVMGNPRINPEVRERIENNENLLSIASVWEMAIKHSSGKLSFELPLMPMRSRGFGNGSMSPLQVDEQPSTPSPFSHGEKGRKISFVPLPGGEGFRVRASH